MKRRLSVTIFALCLGLGAGAQVQAQILFGADGAQGNLSNLYILDATNGSVISTVGPIGFAITGLRFDPTTGVLYGSVGRASGTSPNNLLTINPDTGAGTLVGPYGQGSQTMADIAFTSDGTLYGWLEPSSDDLHTIDKTTGAATSVGEAGLGTFGAGLAANLADVIYFAGNGADGALRTVDRTTGLTTIVATLTGAPFPDGTISALAFDATGTLYGVNGDTGESERHLVTIDIITGVVTDLGPTVDNLDAIAFLFFLTDNPRELAAIYEIAFSQGTIHSINLQRRMDDIRAGSTGFCAEGFAVREPSGKDYSGGKGSDSKVVFTGKENAPVFTPARDNRWGVFITGTGQFVDVDDDNPDFSGYDIETGNFTLGVDYRVGEHFAIGIDGGYARSTAGLLDDGEITVDGGKIGMYATYFTGGFYVDGAAGGGFNNYETRRVALLGFAHGDTEGTEFNALIGTGYDWRIGCLNIGPTATFQYTNVSFDGFTETGSLFPLEIQDQDEDAIRSTVGVRAAFDWKAGGKVIVRPEMRAAWKHEYGDTAYSIHSRLASGSGSIFTVHGPEMGRDSALVGGGFAVLWNDRVSTYVYYDGELGRTRYDSQNVSGGMRLSF